MSQVVVQSDRLKEKRLASLAQEKKVNPEKAHLKWQKTGNQGLDLIAKGAGIAFLPVALLWGLILAIITLVFQGVGFIFKLVGKSSNDKK